VKPPAERIVDELRRVARDWAAGAYVSADTFTLDELLDAAADEIETLRERLAHVDYWDDDE
jgi:hypothetical protein